MKKKAAAAAAAEADDEDHRPGTRKTKDGKQHLPVFVPLDNFTVNLADREAERYAQIGISLELTDAKAGERIKVFMPAIRNNILMVLAHKRSPTCWNARASCEVLREIRRAALEPLAAGDADRRSADGDDAAGARGALLQLHHPVSSPSRRAR